MMYELHCVYQHSCVYASIKECVVNVVQNCFFIGVKYVRVRKRYVYVLQKILVYVFLQDICAYLRGDKPKLNISSTKLKIEASATTFPKNNFQFVPLQKFSMIYTLLSTKKRKILTYTCQSVAYI